MVETEDDAQPYERPNKSKLKREALASLELAQKLVDLGESKWAELSLPSQLIEELRILNDMRQFGAKKRQLKLVAKLLRDTDTQLANKAVEEVLTAKNESKASFHRVENWRDRLLAEDSSAFAEFLSQFPGVDVQQMSQLIRNAKHELSHGKPLKSSKLLFKMLTNIVQ